VTLLFGLALLVLAVGILWLFLLFGGDGDGE
jgi:hypothetical protein